MPNPQADRVARLIAEAEAHLASLQTILDALKGGGSVSTADDDSGGTGNGPPSGNGPG